jgi:hypothetical protein
MRTTSIFKGRRYFSTLSSPARLGYANSLYWTPVDLFEKALRLDPKFILAYCASEHAYDLIYFWFDPIQEQLSKADAAVNNAFVCSLIFPKFTWQVRAIFTTGIGTTPALGYN